MRRFITLVERAENPRFWQWFGKSKVVDEHGQPLVVYHSSRNDFTEFRSGSHFGDQDAANARWANSHGDRRFTSNAGTIYPVYLAIASPLRIADDKGLTDGFDLAKAAAKAGALSQDELETIMQATYGTTAKRRLFELLTQKGYDGLVYRNAVEGSADSWVPFRPNQIKSIYNSGGFNPDSDHISEASRYATEPPEHIANAGRTPVGQYLYHGTPLDCCLNMLKTNMMDIGIDWRGEGQRVSMTRNYDVAQEFAGYPSDGNNWGYEAVLVLDWAKLAKDYPIHPYEDTYPDGSPRESEHEECVYGQVRPLSKYLVSINVPPEQIQAAIADAGWIAMCVQTKGFFGSKRGLLNALLKLTRLPVFNKTK